MTFRYIRHGKASVLAHFIRPALGQIRIECRYWDCQTNVVFVFRNDRVVVHVTKNPAKLKLS